MKHGEGNRVDQEQLDRIGQAIIDKYRLQFLKRDIRVDGQNIRRAQFFDIFGRKIVEELNLQGQFYPSYTSDREQSDIFQKILFDVEREYKQASQQKFSGDIPESRPNVSYIPAVDMRSNEPHLINPESKQLSELKYDAYLRTLHPEDRSAFINSMRLAVFEYDPYDLTTLSMVPFETYEVLRVNLYDPPPWRLKDNSHAKCPALVARMIKHLFPDKESRTFVLDWMYHLLVSRNETYLVLNGRKGVGKGIFAKLVRALVGINNYTEAPESLLDSQFNSALDNKRAIVLDEIKVDKAKHTKLKRYINKYQNIEKKGRDAESIKETFNSFIITNNDETDMYLEFDDRRFSVPDLTSLNLTESLTKEEIQNLDQLLEDENSDLVRDFGYFIFNRGAKEFDQFSTVKGEKFYGLVYTSLRHWQKFLVEEILETRSKEIPLSKLRNIAQTSEENIHFPLNEQKIEDFLNNYKHYGEKVLGSMEKRGKEFFIIVGEVEDKKELL